MAKTTTSIQRDVVVADYLVTRKHGICWGSIIGGALGAIAISLILLILGSGLGLASVSPWSYRGVSAGTFTALSATWLIIMQWASAGVGGYITGRLRGRAANIHTDEVYFRDTAHGFLTWALATLVSATILASAAGAIVSGTAKAGTAVAAAGAAGAGHEAAKDANKADPNAYFVDTLYRSNKTTPSPEDVRAESTRILTKDVADGKISDTDKDRLKSLVAREAGISQDEASARVESVLAQVDETKAQAKQAADDAKKAATMFAIATALSMFLGAFIASVAAVIGGQRRDDYDNTAIV